MSNFVFTFEAASLAVAANLTKQLELFTGTTTTMADDHISAVYHEVPASKAKEFLKIVHDLNEAPINDNDNNVKYIFNVLDAPSTVGATDHENGLNDMIGNLHDWHVKENGGGFDASYSGHKPTSSIPDQGADDDSKRDVDAGSEAKYPFSSKIVPMRVMAAYGSNLTDLLENEAALQTDANNCITTLKSGLLTKIGNHTDLSHYVVDNGAGSFSDNDGSGNMHTSATADAEENYGRKILRQAINQAQGNVSKSNRLGHMFEGKDSSGSVVAGNVSTGYNGDNTLQVTKFNFESGDEMKFILDLNTRVGGVDGGDSTLQASDPAQNTLDVNNDFRVDNNAVTNANGDAMTTQTYSEPAKYRFLAHLKFVPDYYSTGFYHEWTQNHYFSNIGTFANQPTATGTATGDAWYTDPFLTDISGLTLEQRTIYIADTTGKTTEADLVHEEFGIVIGYGKSSAGNYPGMLINNVLSMDSWVAKYGISVSGKYAAWNDVDGMDNTKYVLSVVIGGTRTYLAETQTLFDGGVFQNPHRLLLHNGSSGTLALDADASKKVTF